MLLYACQHYVNSCMNIFIHKIFPMLIIYHTRATVATICTLSMIPAIYIYSFATTVDLRYITGILAYTAQSALCLNVPGSGYCSRRYRIPTIGIKTTQMHA